MTIARIHLAAGALAALAAVSATPSWAAPPSEWYLFPGEGGAMLSQSNGADRETMLLCREGSGRLYVSNSAFTRDMTSLSLRAGDARGRYALVPEGPDTGDGERKFQIAEVATDDAVVTAFRRTGRMTMEAGDVSIELDSTADGRATVGEFLTYCGG